VCFALTSCSLDTSHEQDTRTTCSISGILPEQKDCLPSRKSGTSELASMKNFLTEVLKVLNNYSHWIVWAELTINALCALELYLGQFNRFNTWNLMTQTDVLVNRLFDDLTNKNVVKFMLFTFVIITGLYWLMKQVNLKLRLPTQRYFFHSNVNKQGINMKTKKTNNFDTSATCQSRFLEKGRTTLLYNIEEFNVFTYLYDWQLNNSTIVNFSGIVIQVEEIVNFLKQEMLLKDICQKILKQKIIEKTAQERGISVTSEEIQLKANRLEKPLNIADWLEEQMITVNDWEAGIRSHLLAQKLARYLFDQDVESFFERHRSMFDQFILYQIVVDYEKIAKKIFYDIIDKKISFFEAAYLYDIDEKRRHRCGYEGQLSLANLQIDLATVVLRASVGEILGPFKTEHGYHLLMVEKFIPEQLTSKKRQEILEILFNEWLARELKYMLHISYWIRVNASKIL
jgi:parvulin-like peptidyl-prolyl isomerase